MGQKVNPNGLRLGILRTWDSRWFERRNYASYLHADLKIRQYILDNCAQAGVAQVVIKRSANKMNVEIYVARPGILIGKGGSELEQLKSKLSKIAGKDIELGINILNIRKPEVCAKIVADGIARQIENRVSYRRAMKKAMQSALKLGALGIRVNISGRIGGAEIARMEWYREGRIPLHTLRSNVDFCISEAKTTYGVCGIKVWIYKGDCEVGDVLSRDAKL